ncbi:predicted protein [Plenodomus lingam JN3]|uniref:Predicted protein n=1 Tax=Leptosphaeria maculans (strain JN3 / isolate v23.1.3 / race Av1-4-5-6-7-8) TaxID=985895 RepID=E4ZJ50_LEPMJ|nr:predicted protein [Plenodomus lingam JN3]CBX91481.1 predicted protein [Plenodomus lingam JN3]
MLVFRYTTTSQYPIVSPTLQTAPPLLHNRQRPGGMETLGCGCFLGHFLTADLRRAGTCGKDPAMTIGTDWPPSSTLRSLMYQLGHKMYPYILPGALSHCADAAQPPCDLKGGVIILWSQVRAFEEVEPDGLPAFDGKAR